MLINQDDLICLSVSINVFISLTCLKKILDKN